MKLKNYTLTSPDVWEGRIDEPAEPDSFRMHQVVEVLDLRNKSIENIDFSKFNICLLGYCSDEGIKRNMGREGAKNGPEDIRREFANLPVSFDDNVVIYDAGNVYCVRGNMEEAQQQLSIAIELVLTHGMFPIVLGGGHELALGHYNGIRAFCDKKEYKTKLGIINFDAHFDLRPHAERGSSGTMFSQIAENCQLTETEFNYLCLGIQVSANTKSLFKKADALGASYVLAKDFIEPNFHNIVNKINDFINLNDTIYLTLCSDVINAAFAPGVSSMQPFGLNPETVLNFIKLILKSNKVISFDVAEVSPRFDHDKRTAKLVAIILYAIVNCFEERI